VFAVTIAMVAYLVLHFAEPALAITWSYAHLGRSRSLPMLGAALVVVLPALAAGLWNRPALMLPPGRTTWMHVAIATAVLVPSLIVLGAWFPTPHFSIDVIYFVDAVRSTNEDNARWYLLLWLIEHVAAWLRPWFAADQVIRAANGVFATVAVVALAGAARHLGRTRGEVLAITLLAVSAFGVAQLLMGYLDIYPMPLALTTVYLWSAFATLDGVLHPAVPLAVAAIGPFWYIGLAQLVPSTLVIVAVELRRTDGVMRLAVSAAAAVILAGLATVPWFGHPFAWGAFLVRAKAISKYELGLDPASSLLPLDYMRSATHLREVVHTLLLVDGVGWLLLTICGASLLLQRRPEPKALLLAAVVLVNLAYLVTFDALFGAYADWDLYSYGAAASALLGGWSLVTWGRRCPRATGALVGLALAAAGVHLLARLNALDIDKTRHLAESPYHIATE
jgi:hypothetical protein